MMFFLVTDARFRIHLEAFDELNSNFPGLHEPPECGLIFEVRTGRVTKVV